MCDLVQTCSLPVARAALAAGRSVALGGGTYDLELTGLVVANSGQVLRGASLDSTILTYKGTGNAVEVAKPSSFLQRPRVQDLTIAGDGTNGSSAVGLYIKGSRFGQFENVVVKNFGAGTGVAVEAAHGSGTYYNYFRQIVSGGVNVGTEPNAYGFRLVTTDQTAPTNPGVKLNCNVFELCAAQFNTVAGMTADGINTLALIGCSVEKNASGAVGKGLIVTNSTDLQVAGGYFEGHPETDIELAANCYYSTILRPRLASTNRLTGVSLGATGDFYLTAESSASPGPTQYGSNWAQKMYIGELFAGSVEFVRYSTVARFLFAKLSADSAYRFQIWNDGALEWGGGSSAPDVKLYRSASDTLALGSNDDLQLAGLWNGGRLRLGNNWLWVNSTGKLMIKNGTTAPSSDADGVVVGTQT